MAWIELHDTLPDHPKILAVSELLKIDRDAAIGKLVRLWTWALSNRDNGHLSTQDLALLPDVLRLKTPSKKIVESLVSARLLDLDGDGYRIHDWDEYIFRLRDAKERRRAQNRERAARYRSVTSALQERDTSVTERYSNAATVPNLTVPYIGGGGEEQPRARACAGSDVDEVWKNACVEGSPTEAQRAAIAEMLYLTEDKELIATAISEAHINGATNWCAYARGALIKWSRKGIHTIDDYDAAKGGI